MSCTFFCAFVLLGSVLYVQGQDYNLTTSDRYAVVGSPFTFTCRGDPASTIVWFENNKEYRVHDLGHGQCNFSTAHPKEYTVNCSADAYTLTIKSVNLSQHETVWRCGDEGGRSNEIKLEVRDGPVVSLQLTSLPTKSVLFVAEGSDVTVTCSAKCFLTCDYEWQVTGHVISNSSVLSLADINRTQNGVYTCTATNPDTKETANQTVKIIIGDLRDKNNTHFGEGFATGFAVVIFLIVGAALFLVFWFRKHKRKHTEENAYYNTAQSTANEAPPGKETEGNTGPNSSHGDQENEFYEVIDFDNQSQNASETV